MKRDMDLVREILATLEQHAHGYAPRELKIEGYSEEQLGFHIHVMIDGGLLHGAEVTPLASKSPQSLPTSITWAGYDFLALSKSESVWERAKNTIRREGVGVSFELLKKILAADVSQLLGVN